MLITACFQDADQYNGKKYSIANSQPKPQIYPVRLYLAPAWSDVCGLKNELIDLDEFTKRYLAQLDNLTRIQAVSLNRDINTALTSNIIYLCWEPPGQFCHRQVLGRWLTAEFPGLQVEIN